MSYAQVDTSAALKDVEATVNTLQALNNTPFSDTLELAESIYTQFVESDEPGATFSATYGELQQFDRGYAVSGYQDTVEIPEWETTHQARDIQTIAKFIERIPTTVYGIRHYYIGFWLEGGTLYIDAVRLIDDYDQAYRESQRLNQQAFYDFKNAESIYVNEPVPPPAQDFPAEPTIESAIAQVKAEIVERLERRKEAVEALASLFRDSAQEQSGTQYRASIQNAESFEAQARAFEAAIEDVNR